MPLDTQVAVDYIAFALVFIVALGGITLWLQRTRRGGRILLLAWAVLLVSLAPGWFFTRAAQDEERTRLRDSIMGMAPTYAAELAAMGHQRLRIGTAPDDPLYLAMIEKQKEWLDLNRNVSDIYTFRRGEAGNLLIVDSETDYNHDGVYDANTHEKRSPIGTSWPEKSLQLDRAYAGERGFEDMPYTDEWGTWVSAYVPMRDDGGDVEAVLGVDYPASAWLDALKRARRLALGSLAVYLVSVLGLLTVLAVLRGNVRHRRLAADRTRKIIDQAHDAFIAMNERGEIVDWNPQSSAVFGWAREEAVGRRVVDLLMPVRYRDAHRAGVKRYLETGESHVVGTRIDVTGLHKEGQEFPLEMTITALHEGDEVRFHAFLHDISERTRREEQLREAKEGAEAATRAKSEFVASVSHEIRTPMNGILGMCELLDSTALDRQQRDYLTQMKRSSDTLLHLLNDVLDMSRIEAGKVNIERRPFDIRACIEAVTASLAVRAEAKGLELRRAVDPDVPSVPVGDPGRLGQVIANLVGNAIKFTQTGWVELSVSPGEPVPDGVELRFSVRDTGIGIAKEKQESIFEAFNQEDASTTRRYGGTGLGLSICRHLVRLMGGRMSLESGAGQGATFSFTARFGVADAAALEESEAGTRERAGHVLASDARMPSLKILLAEDGLINQQVAVGLLELEGHQVTVVEDGQQAVDAWRDGAYDLILMDLQMPVMGGLEATRVIRDLEETPGPRVPIIALTAIAMKGDRDRCLRAGMDAYIAKPIDRQEMYDTIRVITAQRAARVAAGPDAGGADDGVVNWTAACRRIPGGEKGVRRLAALMETEGPRLVDEIRRGVALGDAERVRLGAHTLKGSAGHFVAADVVEAAAKAERLAREGDLAAVEDLLPRLSDLVGGLSAALARVEHVDLALAAADARGGPAS